MIRWTAIALLVLPLGAETPTSRVGQPLEIGEVFIPGEQVEPAPRRDRSPSLVVRVLEVKPAEGGFRYDFEVQGLDPGNYDLADFLSADQGADLPAIPLSITSGLPDTPPRAHEIAPGELPQLGGYRTTLIVIGSLWLLAGIGIVAWRKRRTVDEAHEQAMPTLAERLSPLVKAAAAGDLGADERARLDRLVMGHWRERLPEIAALPPAEAMGQLRRHEEASPLVLAIERWLHSPAPTSSAELADLLKPYDHPSP